MTWKGSNGAFRTRLYCCIQHVVFVNMVVFITDVPKVTIFRSTRCKLCSIGQFQNFNCNVIETTLAAWRISQEGNVIKSNCPDKKKNLRCPISVVFCRPQMVTSTSYRFFLLSKGILKWKIKVHVYDFVVIYNWEDKPDSLRLKTDCTQKLKNFLHNSRIINHCSCLVKFNALCLFRQA